MLGICDSKFSNDALGDFFLYRTVGANDTSSAAVYNALAGVWNVPGAQLAQNTSCLDVAHSPKGSTNVIFMFLTGNGAASVQTTLWMCLNPVIYAPLTGLNLYVQAAQTATTKIGQLYTFPNLPAARYIITVDSGYASSTNIYAAFTGPAQGLLQYA